MPPPDYQPRLDALVARVARDHGVEAEGMLKVGGSVSGEIRYAAEELDVDLIVMASHEPRLTDYLIGSNAAHVALHTPASVLVVR
jgi:nucleotide-binding universal stress UspA family protein